MLSLRIKLALWAAGLCGVVLLVFVTSWGLIVYDNMLEEAKFQLREAADGIIGDARKDGFDPMTVAETTTTISAESARVQLISLVSPMGDSLYSTSAWPPLDGLPPEAEGNFDTIEQEGGRWHVMHRSTLDEYSIAVAVELSEIEKEVFKMARTHLSALPFALLFIGFGAWWVAGKASKPVAAITSAAENITAGALSERIPERDAQDELGRLTRAFNTMMDKLETSFRQANRFSSDASHELRTPIAVLQGKIEEALHRPEATDAHRETLADLLEQTQRLKSIIQSLLLFSRSDSGKLGIDSEPIAVDNFISDLEEDMSYLLEDTDIVLEVDTSRTAPVQGDPRLLRLAVFNLLQNAAKFSRRKNGRIRCTTEPDTGWLRISVANTGAEIPAEDRDRIFDRFYRSEASDNKSGGFGLGLSLARVISEAHGGTIELTRSDGEWNEFTLSLPLQ